MKIIIPLLLLFSHNSFAFTVEMKCTNSNELIMVPYAASNMFISDSFYYFMMGIFVYFFIKLIYIRIKYKQHQRKDYVMLIPSTFFIIMFFVSNYYENIEKEKMVGTYHFKNEQIKLSMKDNKLINSKNNQELESLGKYFYNKDANIRILKHKANYYFIDNINRTCEKLVKIK